MRKLRVLLVLSILVMAPGLALAQGESPKWSYIEAGWIDFDPDEGVSDDGQFIGGLMQIFKIVHLIAEYQEIGDYTLWNDRGGRQGQLREEDDPFGQVRWANVVKEVTAH